MTLSRYVFPYFMSTTTSACASLPEMATTTSTDAPSTTESPVATTEHPGNSETADPVGIVVSFSIAVFCAFIALAVVYYYFGIYRERMAAEREALAHTSGGGSDTQVPRMIHVIEGIPMYYSEAPEARRGSTDEEASLQRLAQATPAVIPQSGTARITYHVRSRGQTRRIRVRTLDADPHVFNPLALSSSSAEARACVGHVVATGEEEDERGQQLLGGRERWNGLDYGSALYYSRSAEEHQHKDGSEGGDSDEDIAFRDGSEHSSSVG
ncbi:conserved hypothetical protein [Leishmania braziliensis MHOM/BR/75/M2904]|uniref:Transmembrane protein n=1 Tax=Leishmania braziliensis TaxID=5660 RepID=E9AIU6_LEIBR|nr:conserved hypothetical protein [Leishmania braziliensis MHOM/BR/75/M2904]KAI5687940.1 hypothetical protein MNV84_06305 [Leishmania braziliensis]CAJ2477972.1 unnamed protein product [Leishmania braziliensis]CAJ2478374.1 unnamed protein product [Leishmania braziliensis]CBZ14789.1 conserved hypothetical protein [Leishmania braziliensis MHOM/BR/75/M2904]